MSCSRRVKVGYNGIESTLIYEELRNAVAEYHSGSNSSTYKWRTSEFGHRMI